MCLPENINRRNKTMVKKGSQQRNNEAIREMIANKQEIADNQYVVTDALNRMIIIDTEDGLVYRFENDEIIECNTVETSKKQNGYLYVEIVINVDGELININYAQHSLIAMCAHTDDYDSLVEDGKTPICNHKDNCPWNNKSTNLEWTTQALNILHGKIVNSLNTNSRYLELMLDKQYTTIKHNNSNIDYITLLYPISVDDIKNYEYYVTHNETKLNRQKYKSLKDKWNLNKKDSVIHGYYIYEFVKWFDN
jgi:hypothetical protein